jgi:uncharacterized protein YjbI with pentapeptide repeats
MSDERDYVNKPLEAEWYDGDIPDEWRCQYEFERSHEYMRRDVKGRPCGLLAAGDIRKGSAETCVFHRGLGRFYSSADDVGLAAALAGICQRAYLGEADLKSADLSSADLSSADLSGADLAYADLSGARLLSADLSGANLLSADLSGADLRGADLSGADLEGTDLSGVDIQRADLSGANLCGADLSGANVWSAILSGADLRYATIEPLWVSDAGNMKLKTPDMQVADLSDALLTGMSLAPGANLEGADIDCPIRDEVCARDPEAWRKLEEQHPDWRAPGPPTLRECESIYRQLKLNLQESGDYQRAGEFYLRERECYRARAKEEGRWLEWLGQSLIYYVCGHGERPGWVVGCTVGLIVLFAWLQGCLGIAGGDGELLVGGWGPPAWEPFRKALYFSTVTFTSLGFGDLRPTSAWGETVAGIEAALGLALMSLLLVCIVRRFSR